MFQCNLQMTLIHWLWNIPKACQFPLLPWQPCPWISIGWKLKCEIKPPVCGSHFVDMISSAACCKVFLFYFPWIKLRNYHTHKYACVLVFPLDIVIFNFQCKDGGGVIERKNLRKQVKYSTSYILPKGNKTRLANF